MNFNEQILTVLKRNGIKLRPCSTIQLMKIEEFVKDKLPAVYVDFLLTMGEDAGEFMPGSDCFYTFIFDLKSWAIETIEENHFKPLPENAFVFWMHQGYQFAFFQLGSDDNPNVYYFNECERMTEYRNVGTLIDFYSDMMKLSRIN